ncbi:hypothetical protein [Jiulongibacter sediminis]|nr:hypothetical protein [Jiulongibacter sediminis]
MKHSIIPTFILSICIFNVAEAQVNEIQNNTTSVTILPGSINSTHISNNVNALNKDNLVLGKDALLGYSVTGPVTSASGNVVIGHDAMNRGFNGNDNVVLGKNSGYWSVFSDRNVAIGADALYSNSPNSGLGNNNDDNVAIGYHAMKNFWSYNSSNVGIGSLALENPSNSTVSVGFRSGNGGADRSVLLGHEAGYTGGFYNNVLIGYQAGFWETSADKLYIENSNSSTPLIGGDFVNDVVSINRPISSLSGTPNDKFQVGGNVKVYGNMAITGSRISTLSDFSSDFALNDQQFLVFYVGTGGHTVTLPSALPFVAYEFKIINQGGGAITTSVPFRTGLGTTSQTIPASSVLHIISDGTNWRKIN